MLEKFILTFRKCIERQLQNCLHRYNTRINEGFQGLFSERIRVIVKNNSTKMKYLFFAYQLQLHDFRYKTMLSDGMPSIAWHYIGETSCVYIIYLFTFQSCLLSFNIYFPFRKREPYVFILSFRRMMNRPCTSENFIFLNLRPRWRCWI